ncbi:MAG: DUF1822 family protein [Elainellaceae cyanobacterium]
MMTNSLSITTMFDADSASPNTIFLSNSQIDQAIALSEQVREPEQWQVYRQAIALTAFKQWLDERDSQLFVQDDRSTLQFPEYASLINAVCNIQIGHYRICLIPTGSVADTVVFLPRATVEISDFVPHLYVLIEVSDEYEHVQIKGCLRRDSLFYHLKSVHLPTNADWTYSIPLDWFSLDPERILLYLRCLEPNAIQSQTVAPHAHASVAQVKADLTLLRPRIQSSDRPLWRLLMWEQASTILCNPELLDQVYSRTQTGAHALQDLKQRAINVGLWLQNQVDELAQEWILLPPPVLETVTAQAMRSPVEQFDDVISALTQQGMMIPSHARGAYQDLKGANAALRLYAVTWKLPELSHSDEWTLLLMLGAQPGAQLPEGVRLQVHDEHHVLDEQVLTTSTSDAHLFSRVIGDLNEQFSVTIKLANGEVVTRQPFVFHLS